MVSEPISGESVKATMRRKRVGILIFPEVEILDFCGPFEVFIAARLDEQRRREESSPFEVNLVAENGGVIMATGGLRVIPDCTLADCPTLDILVVPGGWGTRREIGNAQLLRWIAERGKEVEILASVCTGAMLLGQAGLLEGRHATTHGNSLAWMRAAFPNVTVEEHLNVVEDGQVLTSAGISTGIDLALRIVIRYYGENVGRATAQYLEYPFPNNNARRGERRESSVEVDNLNDNNYCS